LTQLEGEEAHPSVSVIIPHYRDVVGLRRCLAALERQTYPAARWDVIVVDNASPEGPAQVAELIDNRAKLVIVTERGAGPARNGGVAASTGEVLAFIDSDCVAEPQWLAEGVRALERHDFVGGRVKVLVDNDTRMTGAEAFERVFAFDFKTYIEQKRFTGSGDLFCRRSMFDQVGGFRPAVSEDVDWSRRALAAGFSLGYAPSAGVGHPARADWEQLRGKWRRVNRETYNLMSGTPGGRLRWIGRCLLLPPSAFVHLPRVLASSELNTLDQRLAAAATLFRIRFWRCLDALRLAVARE
jgi:GT2 family glycosyltransferase